MENIWTELQVVLRAALGARSERGRRDRSVLESGLQNAAAGCSRGQRSERGGQNVLTSVRCPRADSCRTVLESRLERTDIKPLQRAVRADSAHTTF